MRDEEIIGMAEKCGLEITPVTFTKLKFFARQVAHSERLACANVVAEDQVIGATLAAALMARRNKT